MGLLDGERAHDLATETAVVFAVCERVEGSSDISRSGFEIKVNIYELEDLRAKRAR